jgi:hypothetical protein
MRVASAAASNVMRGAIVTPRIAGPRVRDGPVDRSAIPADGHRLGDELVRGQRPAERLVRDASGPSGPLMTTLPLDSPPYVSSRREAAVRGVSPERSTVPTRTPGRTRPVYCWS